MSNLPIVLGISAALILQQTAGVLSDKVKVEDHIKECAAFAEDQVKNYGDLCAESSSGYESMKPREAHYEGVKCAVETILLCLEKPHDKK